MNRTMNQLSASCLLARVRKTLAEHLTIWLLPTVAIGTLGTIYALVRPPTWEAVQELIIREEAVGELDPDGRFNSTDARKAAQEMVTQIARNRNVVAGDVTPICRRFCPSNSYRGASRQGNQSVAGEDPRCRIQRSRVGAVGFDVSRRSCTLGGKGDSTEHGRV